MARSSNRFACARSSLIQHRSCLRTVARPHTAEEWDAWAAGDATGDEMATMIAFRGI
jgi:hypothetical protein